MKTIAISIPKPCHEDWNKMTPDAKGAFCASCQKSVYDFSNKTDQEIISVFEKEEKGKVCGRFAPSQLSRPVVSFGNPTTTNRLAIFAYALLLVFGAALFNGAEAYGQEIKGDVKVEVMGKVAVHPIETPVETETTPTTDTTVKATITPLVKCGFQRKPDVEYKTLGEVYIEEVEPRVFGDTMIQELPDVDTVIVEDIGIDTIPMVEPTPIEYVLGMIAYVTGPEVEPLIIEQPVDTATTLDVPVTEEPIPDKLPITDEPVIVPSTELEVFISPNPSSGQITLGYTLENTMPVRIDLFDITGKMVKTLSNQNKQYAGKYNVTYNISDLPNGIYIATLTTADQQVSTKIILTR